MFCRIIEFWFDKIDFVINLSTWREFFWYWSNEVFYFFHPFTTQIFSHFFCEFLIMFGTYCIGALLASDVLFCLDRCCHRCLLLFGPAFFDSFWCQCEVLNV